MQPIKWYILNLRAHISNFIYFRKRNVFNVLHKVFPSMHQYRWCWTQECGCCGFEGVACEQCDLVIIIGHTTGYSNDDHKYVMLESGDIVEYDY